jgi:hypothetical protein
MNYYMNPVRKFLTTLYRLAGTIALISGSVCVGSVITINQEVNLEDFAKRDYDLHYPGAPMVTIRDGDDVTVTFNFQSGARLLLNNATSAATKFATGWPWLESWGQNGFFEIKDISISLLNPELIGSGTVAMNLSGHSDGNVHLGPLGYMDLDAYSSVSFTGITATYHVTSVPGGTNYYQPWIHGYFDVTASIIANSPAVAKRFESFGNEKLVCFNTESGTRKPTFAIGAELPTAVISVSEETPSVLLILAGLVLLRNFARAKKPREADLAMLSNLSV